jgi:hypothetical protein
MTAAAALLNFTDAKALAHIEECREDHRRQDNVSASDGRLYRISTARFPVPAMYGKYETMVFPYVNDVLVYDEVYVDRCYQLADVDGMHRRAVQFVKEEL